MTCPHADRAKHAFDLCRSCYDKSRGERASEATTPRAASPREARAEKQGAQIKGDQASVVSEAKPELGSVEDDLRSFGMEPDDWDVYDVKVNWWHGMTSADRGNELVKLYQRTIRARRRTPLEWLFPAVDIAPRPRTLMPVKYVDPTLLEEPQTVVLLPDPHCPYQDLELEKRVHSLLAWLQPQRVTCLGDVCDFSSISRHRDNPAWMASAQENIQEAFAWWSRLRDVAPGADMDWIEGNHDARIRNELLQRAERLYGIKPAAIPGVPTGADALSLQHLCHLDALQVNFVGPPLEGDNYHHAGLDLGPELHARHGFLVGANSPMKTLESIGMSVVYGHTHRQDIHHKTLYRGSKPIGRQVAVECGFLGRLEGGLGYAVNPKAQQGLAVATLWPDGAHNVELVPYDGRALQFRGRRF